MPAGSRFAGIKKIAKCLTPKNWLACNGYITFSRTYRSRRQRGRVGLRGCDLHHANHDSASHFRHADQRHPDRHRDSEPQLSAAGAARVSAADERLPAAPDAAAGARREEVGQQRPVAGVAEAFHDRTQMRRRRGIVLQGREGRKHVLHRQRPVSPGRIRHRIAGRRHRRRIRHAVALELAHPDAGMHRRRRGPERELHPGRGTLRAESGVRLLLPASRQRPVVPEHREA